MSSLNRLTATDYIGAIARGSEKESFSRGLPFAVFLDVASVSLPSLLPARAAFASGLFSEPAAGRLPLALRRLVCRHTLNPIFVRLRFLIFLIPFLSLRHGNLLVESANTSPRVSFVFRLRL
jgi:hypothetical protein